MQWHMSPPGVKWCQYCFTVIWFPAGSACSEGDAFSLGICSSLLVLHWITETWNDLFFFLKKRAQQLNTFYCKYFSPAKLPSSGGSAVSLATLALLNIKGRKLAVKARNDPYLSGVLLLLLFLFCFMFNFFTRFNFKIAQYYYIILLYKIHNWEPLTQQ